MVLRTSTVNPTILLLTRMWEYKHLRLKGVLPAVLQYVRYIYGNTVPAILCTLNTVLPCVCSIVRIAKHLKTTLLMKTYPILYSTSTVHGISDSRGCVPF